MTLTNYWWLIIWLFAGGALLGSLPKKQESVGNQIVERWSIKTCFLMVLPYIIWAGFRHDYFGDTALYRKTYLALDPSVFSMGSVFFGDQKDPGFLAFSVLMKTIIGNADELFFLFIAAFQMISIALVFRKYSSNFWATLFLFIVSTDYLSWMHNGMRQFIAVAMIFGSFGLIIKKKYLPLIITILIASLFHGSAMLMIPIVFIVQGRAWNKKTMFTLLLTMIVVVFIDRFTPLLNELLQDTQYNGMVTSEVWTEDDGTNIFRTLVYSMPALLSLFGIKYIRAADDRVINVCVNCSIVTMALYLVATVSSGIYIGRLPIYTTFMGYMALPRIINLVFEHRSERVVKFVMYGAYLAFFYYQMHFTWGVL